MWHSSSRFPWADAWLLGAMIVSVAQLWRRRPSALLWLIVTGGAGVYLFALDVLYDLEHGIYAKPQGSIIELAVNILTFTLSAALLRFAWRFRVELLAAQTPADRQRA
jgi:phosphate/sulfate permease